VRKRAVILGTALVLSACDSRQERSDCWDARQASRDAIAQGQLDRASQLLEQARKTCGDQSADDLRRIDGLIADRKEAERQLEQAENQGKLHGSGASTERFVEWATGPIEEFESNLTHIDCASRGTPEFGFCAAERKGQPKMQVRYWDTHRAAVRYSFESKLPLECEDLGDHRRVRQWMVGQRAHELCEITQREARNLSALLINGANDHQMFIFSFEYLKRDPDFERMLRARK
jgi:hypothetical protein